MTNLHRNPPGVSLKLFCLVCNKIFIPHPRTQKIQKTCGDLSCRKKHRALYRRRYRKLNVEAEKAYQQKIKENRSKDFWKDYRKAHPEYAEHNRLQSRLRKRLRKSGLQRQLDIFQVARNTGLFSIVEQFAMSNRWELEEIQAKAAL